ncbi:hypothetical protein D1872_316340 [compost metagenome]
MLKRIAAFPLPLHLQQFAIQRVALFFLPSFQAMLNRLLDGRSGSNQQDQLVQKLGQFEQYLSFAPDYLAMQIIDQGRRKQHSQDSPQQ